MSIISLKFKTNFNSVFDVRIKYTKCNVDSTTIYFFVTFHTKLYRTKNECLHWGKNKLLYASQYVLQFSRSEYPTFPATVKTGDEVTVIM